MELMYIKAVRSLEGTRNRYWKTNIIMCTLICSLLLYIWIGFLFSSILYMAKYGH